MKIIKPSYEIMQPLNREEILHHLEKVGRVCYKSEGNATPDSAGKFVQGLIKRGHESIIEHYSFSVRFIVDRGISHEIVRHRLASYAQESSRYCVSGNAKLTTNNPHEALTVKGFYEKKINSKNGAWKRITIRQYDEEKGELVYKKAKDIIFNGIKQCIRIKTKLGYELECTPDHLILTNHGYKESGVLGIGTKIMVNGTNELYKNKDWLYYQNIELNKTFVQISKEFGFNVSTLKKWARKFGLPKKGTGYFNVGRVPFNKGKQIPEQVNALRKYHHCGRRKDKILKEDTVNYQKHAKDHCEICGAKGNVHVHHVDKNRSNNHPENLITLCASCHGRIHSQNLLTTYFDEIVSVEDAGEKEVYDISIDSASHNFVANGVIAHNCNYSRDKFGSEITVIEPLFHEGTNYSTWMNLCNEAETRYFDLLSYGATPEQARSVLPTSLKTELIMTANLREWRYFLRLRTSRAAHPQMREVTVPLLEELKTTLPEVFGDIGGEE